MIDEPLLVVTGGHGQLGRELVRWCPAGWRVAAPGSDEMDITDAGGVRRYIADRRPAVVVNAAAYTAVDRAETERERAWAVNADGAANVAVAADGSGARLIHISTDFVFDGRESVPYAPDAEPAPVNEYGRSKLAGEERVRAALGHRAAILRTAWLYAAGGPNFVLTMVRLLRERGHVRVVSDQLGTPTWAGGLAAALWRAAALPDFRGTHHWTDAGVASWYDFAVAIAEESEARGLLNGPARVEPIRAAEYPTPARRPAFSVLDKTSAWAALGTPPHWRVHLRTMVAELTDG